MSKIFFVLFVTNLLVVPNLLSQNFEGKITDKDQNPILGSTVLIKESKQGLSCNDDGKFQVTLPVGEYHIEYRCLGYESHIEVIVVDGVANKTYRDIVLKEKSILLREVIVSNKQDYAYEIMRNVIKKAPYHQNILKEYEAESYIKGNMELTKVSKLVDKMSSSEGTKMSDYKDKLFVQESYNDIKYQAPDQYEQTVRAFSSSIPDNLDSKDVIRLAASSLYLPRFSGLVSPLHPQSFTYYNFRYEGYSEEGGTFVNKIKVTPKLKNSELVSGYLYIAEGTWDIRYADLTSTMFGIQQTFTITYGNLGDIIFMPISYINRVEVNIMGVKGYFSYHASIKYKNYVINDSIQNNAETKKQRRSLEIKRNNAHTIKTDSLASQRDTLYWAQIRNIPLSNQEELSYQTKDSVQHKIDSLRKQHNDAKFKPWDLIEGGRIGGDSTKLAFKYGGILGVLRDYNFVDGFGLGQKLEISTKVNQNQLVIIPEAYYTTARKKLIWKTNVEFDFSPLRLGHLSVSLGDVSSDYNTQGANRLDNAISSLVWGKNASMFYRQQYVQIKNEIDLANGLRLSSQVKIADRSSLQNNTTYSFFGAKRKIKENIVDLSFNNLTSFGLALQYTPKQYYSIRKGKKQYEHADFPTFGIAYCEGLSLWRTDNSRFRRLEGKINQEVKTDLFSKLKYEINGGTYLGNRTKINFADFKHLNTSDDLWLTSKSPLNSFMLLDAYEASTNDFWFSSQVNYHSKYILLKRLPFLQNKLFDEAIHLKYLYTPNKKNYTEVGYSIDIFNSLSFGAHCSFDKFKYESFGVRLSFNLEILR